ncbi:MAG: zinc ribbon domain-containing protein [Anaerolineales bacterium]
MDFGSIFLLLALVAIVGLFLARPLQVRGWKSAAPELDIELSELLAERERVLEALAELDFDNEMGKVPDSLYPIQREALVKRGAAVLRLLDEHIPASPEAAGGEKVAYDQDDPVEALIAAKRVEKHSYIAKNDTKNKYCANCGAKLQPGDKFCADCGKKL